MKYFNLPEPKKVKDYYGKPTRCTKCNKPTEKKRVRLTNIVCLKCR